MTNDDFGTMIDFNELGRINGFDPKEVNSAFIYLLHEGLIEGFGAGSSVMLTHEGIIAVESVLRKVNFDDDIPFNQVELFQLKEILNDLKDKINRLELGQQVIFNRIDEVFEEAKSMQKKDWKDYLLEQSKNWVIAQTLTEGGKIAIAATLEGLNIMG
ncbi:hypothetical protein [Plebeiibacterium sediminum]|uniref:Uncharacterized protein n=1 Tax=Plebeiibacterium sediminum TaxID=2992112 RepID=A0AAE3M0M5_9BACT|nr:hypothetical protein [Plebeiobacterium sediminum]MCW3784919.1 hypothetical protein [Plebeiobacterium sediminum]